MKARMASYVWGPACKQLAEATGSGTKSVNVEDDLLLAILVGN